MHLKHFNKIKHFTIGLLSNNSYFWNVTSHLEEHTNKGYLWNKNVDNRIHFSSCKVHENLLNTLRDEMCKINLLTTFPKNLPYFYDTQIDANHPANVIFMLMLHILYSLRYSETIPNFEMVKWHIEWLLKLALIMYPHSYEWHLAQNMFSVQA